MEIQNQIIAVAGLAKTHILSKLFIVIFRLSREKFNDNDNNDIVLLSVGY